MNKALKGAGVVLAIAALALGTAACGEDDGGSADAATSGTTGTAAASSGSGAGYTVALLNAGSANDGSWGQSTYDGLEEAKSELGITEAGHAENLVTPDEYVQQGTAFAREKTDLVLMANGSVPQALVKVAQENPDVTVCEAAVTIPAAQLPKNSCTYDPEQQQGAFLAGALAGLTTKTNKLGVVAGFAFPALTRQVEGFILGARYTNPEVEVQQVYINSWTDTAAAKAAANSQYAGGADILFSATDSATQGLFAAAQEGEGRYVIASYFDSHDQAPNVVLTSVIYNLDGVTKEMIRRGVEGEIKPENYTFGLDFGVGELAPFYELDSVVPAEAKTRVEEIKQGIEDGTIVVPGSDVLGVKGAAEKIDTATLETAG